jgi:hypothetical protein
VNRVTQWQSHDLLRLLQRDRSRLNATNAQVAAEKIASTPKDDVTYVGTWATKHSECNDDESTQTLIYKPGSMQGYESICRFMKIERQGPNRWKIRSNCEEADEKWVARTVVVVDGDYLMQKTDNNPPETLVRCPRK